MQRIYLIGGGFIAGTHARATAKLPNPENVEISVCDPKPEALEKIKSEFPSVKAFSDAASMLAEPAKQSDIVIVATPVNVRAELATLSLDSGRHTLCEKPFAMNRNESRAILQKANNVKRLVGCCSSRFLGLPTTRHVKGMIERGALGRLYHATFVHRANRGRAGVEYQPEILDWCLDSSKNGGGILQDWGTYDLTTLNFVLDPIQVEVMTGWTAQPETDSPVLEDKVYDVEGHAGAALIYHLKDGARLTVTYERAACTHGASRRTVEIEGARGALAWDWLGVKKAAIDDGGTVTHSFDVRGKVEKEIIKFPQLPNTNEWERPLVDFFRRIHGEPVPFAVNEQAVFNFSCICAIYDCAATGAPQRVTP